MLAALWLTPLFARSIAQVALVPLAVPAMLLAFVFVLQRARLHCDHAALRSVAHQIAAE
jgi:hypothetical protein